MAGAHKKPGEGEERRRPSSRDGEQRYSKSPERGAQDAADRMPRFARDRNESERASFRTRRSAEGERERPPREAGPEAPSGREERRRPASRDGEKRWSKPPGRGAHGAADRKPRGERERPARRTRSLCSA